MPGVKKMNIKHIEVFNFLNFIAFSVASLERYYSILIRTECLFSSHIILYKQLFYYRIFFKLSKKIAFFFIILKKMLKHTFIASKLEYYTYNTDARKFASN